MADLIYPGGLMRCCMTTLGRVRHDKTDTPQDGDEIACDYCESSMVWRGDGWHWAGETS